MAEYQHYPCKSNVGEIPQHNKVWCSELGRGHVKAQLVSSSVCRDCKIRTGEEPSRNALSTQHDKVWKQYGHGMCQHLSTVSVASTAQTCCGKSAVQQTQTTACSLLKLTHIDKQTCWNCSLRTTQHSLEVVVPLFNLTHHRKQATLKALDNYKHAKPYLRYIVAIDPDEDVDWLQRHDVHVTVLKRLPTQRYFLKEELCNLWLREHARSEVLAFLDADAIFSVKDWPDRCMHIAKHYDFSQMFERCAYHTTSGQVEADTHSSTYKHVNAVTGKLGWPGLGWVAKTSTWKDVQGFPSIIPTGNGDGVFLAGLLRNALYHKLRDQHDIERYANRSVGYLKDVTCYHVFDGVKFVDKKYEQRLDLLLRLQTDMFRMADNGLPEFAVQSSLRTEIENVCG